MVVYDIVMGEESSSKEMGCNVYMKLDGSGFIYNVAKGSIGLYDYSFDSGQSTMFISKNVNVMISFDGWSSVFIFNEMKWKIWSIYINN